MGFLSRMRKDQEAGLPEGWKTLTTVEEAASLIERSKEKPVGIFKHSIRCGISSMVKYQLEGSWNFGPEEIDFYYLDLITYRPTSNAVAELTGVHHQSPQLIVLQNGQVVHHSSHHAISVANIHQVLKQ